MECNRGPRALRPRPWQVVGGQGPHTAECMRARELGGQQHDASMRAHAPDGGICVTPFCRSLVAANAIGIRDDPLPAVIVGRGVSTPWRRRLGPNALL